MVKCEICGKEFKNTQGALTPKNESSFHVRLANAAGSMLYNEHKRSKKRLKAAAVDVPKSTTGTST